MPSINRTRLVNTKYNDGNNYYDDFILKLGGAHTLIDMINGLGKTFFLQCMAQPMLPNAKFKQEFPISLLFDKNNDNNTIHSLVEWELDKGSSFKYALVGFCAYKKEKVEQVELLEEEESGEFGTLLYICYYNTPNAYDLEGIPLTASKDESTKKVMNYKELEKYLKSLQASPLKDYAVVINRTKKEHLKALAMLNINSVEWKHLMGINASEANAEKYLRSYSTASSFIQDFLIPTIEESYRLRHEGEYQTEESRARTLMKLRQTLVTLQQKEALEEEYRYIEASCEKIYAQLGLLEERFKEKEQLVGRLSGLQEAIKAAKWQIEDQKEVLLKEVTTLELRLKEYEQNIEALTIEENAYGIKEALEQLVEFEKKAKALKKELFQKDKELAHLNEKKNEHEAQKLYRDYLSYAQKKRIKEEEYEARSKEHAELVADYSYWGNIYGNRLLKQLRLKEEASTLMEKELKALKVQEEETKLKKERLMTEEGYYSLQMREKEAVLVAKETALSGLQKHFRHLTKEQLEEALIHQKEVADQLKEEVSVTMTQLEELKEAENKIHIKRKITEADEARIDEKVKLLQNTVDKVYEAKAQLEVFEKRYHTYELMSYLGDQISVLRESATKRKRELEHAKKKLAAIEVGEGIVLTEGTLKQFEKVASKYPSALLGSIFLENKSLEEKKQLLEQTILLPYSILLSENDFKKLEKDMVLLRQLEGEVVPFINQSALVSGEMLKIEGLGFTTKDIAYFIDRELKEKEIKKLKKETLALVEAVKMLEENLEHLEKDRTCILDLMHIFTPHKLEVEEDLLLKARNEQAQLQEQMEQLGQEVRLLKGKEEQFTLRLTVLKEKEVTLLEVLKNLEEEWEALTKWEILYMEKETVEGELKELTHVSKLIKEELKGLEENLQALLHVCDEKALGVRGLMEEVIVLRTEVSHLSFKIEEDEKYAIVEIAFEEAKAKYELYEKRLREEAGDVKLLEQSIKEYLELMKQKEQEMLVKSSQYSPAYFESRPVFEGDYMAYIGLLMAQMQELAKQIEGLKEDEREAREAFIGYQGAVGNMKEQFKKNFKIAYEEVILKEGNSQEEITRVAKEKATALEEIKKIKEQMLQADNQKTVFEREIFKLMDMIQKLSALTYKYQLQLKMRAKEVMPLSYFKDAEKEAVQILADLSREELAYTELLKEVLEKLEAPELVHFKGDLDRLLLERPIDELGCKRYKELIGGENGYLINLREEKERIKQTIIELKKDEESFITQCIQKCEQLYNDLMSLSELSKIELHGRIQEMIRIVVMPLEEELRFAKMRSYINGLVEQVEHIEENKKQAFLASHLTLKELFTAFIVNIKKSDVRIYKVEDLAENSRELPWSRAIGSTGQSNGMYMSIFICLISYIRKLYNPHIGEDSRKFIMLDSPFSGTAAAYIWEPVIKLLDRNNVQLLCVGYDIPSHLMSFFDVKYNLAAEYDMDKKQTIVVENIKSTMNLDELSYGKFIGQQLML